MLPLTLSEAVENLIRAKFVEFVASKSATNSTGQPSQPKV